MGVVLMFVMGAAGWGAIDGKELTIGAEHQVGAPYFYGRFDAAGFSDWIWYGQSPLHPHDLHELLSGEWAAAIYYDGIDSPSLNDPNRPNEHEAMWLTRLFEYPNWPTNSTFTAPGICAARHNPINPTPLNNSGQSLITNGTVEITIDYEVVDLEELGVTYSPMSYIADPNTGAIGYMYSDRYVILQTYTIRNITGQTLTNLEFYQFLHSHGADEYGPRVNSTYCDVNLHDPLVNYIPYDAVHQVGNFRYDITQWNGPHTVSSHVDFVGFSSTIEPDWIDSDTFKGHYGRPPYGTHINIEQRQLNGLDYIYDDEVGGAMGWALGSLDPNETTSKTIAFMFGPLQETSDLIVVKTDDVEPGLCVSPGNPLTYSICWQNIGLLDAENAVLVDYLPAGVTVPVQYWFDPNTFEIYSSEPGYDEVTHTYTWNLGTIPSGTGGCIDELNVIVNELAEPGMLMQNRAVLTTSIGQVSTQWSTRICCWDTGEVIYVDSRATGADIGTSWQHAYTDLQKALARANAGCGTEIWVASGPPYDPGRLPDTSFVIPDGVGVYGGFAGNETSRNQRNPQRYKTILTGGADAERNDTVVTMGHNTRLDGFTVTEAAEYGIYGSGVDFTIKNCTVEKSLQYGIRAANSNVTVIWCNIRNNGLDGVFHQGTGYQLTVENCWIRQNRQHGIRSQNSTPTVKNSIVSESDLSQSGNPGIRIINPAYPPVLYNNTFSHNRGAGISFTDNHDIYGDPNNLDYPDVQNCILWHNNEGGSQITGFGREYIYHSCIYDPNDPDGEDYTLDVNFNFSANPQLAYMDPNNVRIRYDSPCRDAGNSLMDYDGQLDMDGRVRVLGAAVDIGAYEIDCEDVSNPFDWNADGVVNFHEFMYFSRAWLSHDPNDPAWLADPNLADPNLVEAWNPMCNLADTGDSQYTIDLADLLAFLDLWLWTACWRADILGGQHMMMFGCDAEDILFRESKTMVFEPPVQIKSTQDQIFKLTHSIEILRHIWLEQPYIQQEIDADDWRRFMDAVYHDLYMQQIKSVQIK